MSGPVRGAGATEVCRARPAFTATEALDDHVLDDVSAIHPGVRHNNGNGIFIGSKTAGGHLVLNCDAHDNYDPNSSQGMGQMSSS